MVKLGTKIIMGHENEKIRLLIDRRVEGTKIKNRCIRKIKRKRILCNRSHSSVTNGTRKDFHLSMSLPLLYACIKTTPGQPLSLVLIHF